MNGMRQTVQHERTYTWPTVHLDPSGNPKGTVDISVNLNISIEITLCYSITLFDNQNVKVD